MTGEQYNNLILRNVSHSNALKIIKRDVVVGYDKSDGNGFKCYCISDKGRKARYVCGNTPSIGFFEGFVCDTCKTHYWSRS